MDDKEYEILREKAIDAYARVYKDSLAFDLIGADKSVRTRMIADPVYLKNVKRIKAEKYAKQLEEVNSLIGEGLSGRGDIKPGEVLRAVEIKNKLLFAGDNVDADESNAINIAFIAMSKEDFENTENITVFEGEKGAKLSADFGKDEDDIEARAKADIAKRMKEKKESE